MLKGLLAALNPHKPKLWPGLIRAYRPLLSVAGGTKVITLGEGNTPLVRSLAIEERLKVSGLRVYLKFEGANPSGSFKDRGMTTAITQAMRRGLYTTICASTGNTSASAAAYTACARAAGFDQARCIVLIPDGYVALGKLSQALMYGAQVVQVAGNFDRALNIVRELSETRPIALVNSVNPDRIEGQKTAAFELCDQLGQPPDILSLPVGNAGNISAYWKGFTEYRRLGLIAARPTVFGFQAAGAAPIVLGYPVENPETIATAIRIGNPASWKTALKALSESGGFIDSVTDEEILEAYSFLHSAQGLGCEPASAASVAGLFKAAQMGKLFKGATVVCVLTGNGLKDPETALKSVSFEPLKCPADATSVAECLSL